MSGLSSHIFEDMIELFYELISSPENEEKFSSMVLVIVPDLLL